MPEKLRAAAAQAELRGDWDQAALFNMAADRIIALEAQNVAYRQALQSDVIININTKKARRFFGNGKETTL